MFDILLLLLVSLWSVQGSCRTDEIQCHSGLCIPNTARCDGHRDCPGGEDELNCRDQGPCRTNEIQCHSGLCIPNTARCDGHRDCPGGEDELNCRDQGPCRTNEIQCHSGLCIPNTARCDRHRDCPGGEDELNCRDQGPCRTNEIQCHSGLCIPNTARCNGHHDCPGGEDELNCRDPGSCRTNEIQCHSGLCIPNIARCDGHRDCPGGEDELNCRDQGVNNSRRTCRKPVKRYSFSHPLKKETWYGAKRYCENEGKKLATIKNQDEQDQVEHLMIINGLSNENVWLGLSDIKEEGFFKWEDGTDLVYTKFENWKPGEPNKWNWRENPSNIEHCVQANGRDNFWPESKKFQWNDMPCDYFSNVSFSGYILCENLECTE